MKDLFVVELAVKLGFELLKKQLPSWIGKTILGGPIGFILTHFAQKFLGMLVEQGILLVDFGIISAKVAMENEEYAKFAKEAYDRAKKRVYSEEEKQSIREEYLKALSKFGTIGRIK